MKKRRFNIAYIFCFVLFFLTGESILAVPNKRFTVVIDAGHGGHDPGAIGKRGREKNINLNVALKLGKLIENSCNDTRVVYTRKTDVFVPLHRRAEIANDAKADLFISVHTNSVASRNSNISGTETYTLGLHRTQDNLEVAKKENSVILIEDDYKQRYAGFNPNSSESYIIFEFMQDKNMSQSVSFAQMIQKQFRNKAKRVDKGVHQAGFLVLRETSMPSVLIELGYITNPSEESYLLSDKGSSAMANSIYQAFVNYKQHKQGNTSATYNAENRTEPDTDSSPTGKSIEETKQSKSPAAATGTDTTKEARTNSAQNGNTRQAVAPKQTSPTSKSRSTATAKTNKPVFKIQILTSSKKLPSNSSKFKGLSPVGSYQENGLYKYTYGESTDYNQVLRTKRNKVEAKFKDAFIIAFKDGVKMNVSEAIKEFKKNR